MLEDGGPPRPDVPPPPAAPAKPLLRRLVLIPVVAVLVVGPGVAHLPAPDGRTIGDIVRGSDLSVPEIMAVWAERDGCDGDPGPAVPVEGDVSLVAYDRPDGVAVELDVVDGGGHHRPGAREDPAHAPPAEAIDELGEPSPVSANDLMWSFFARHPRR